MAVIPYLSHGIGVKKKTPAKKKPAAKPVAKKKQPPVRAPTLSPLSQRQLAEARALAAAGIDPGIREIEGAVAAAEQARLNQARAAEGITRALGALSAGDAEASRAAYAAAADRIGQYGGVFTGQLRDLQTGRAAAANEQIARLVPGGSPGVSTQAEGNANAVAMTGMQIPGEVLAGEAARARDQAAAHRLAGGLRVADQFGIADYKAAGEVNALRAEIAKLEAKRPGLVMEALADIRQQENAQRATDTQIGYLQLQQAKTNDQRAIAMTNLTGQLHIVMGKGAKARVVNTGKPAAGSDASVAQVRAETSKANAATAAATAAAATAQREQSQARAEQGRNARAEAARKAQVEAARIRANATKAGTKPPTVAQKNTIINGANSAATNIVNAYADKVWANIPGTEARAKGESDAKYNARIAAATAVYRKRLSNNYGTMMAQVINAIGPNLKLIGYTPEMIKAVARRIVGAVATPAKTPQPATGR